MSVCFPRRDIESIDPDRRGGGKELGRVRSGETLTKIYCRKNLFSIIKKTKADEKVLETSELDGKDKNCNLDSQVFGDSHIIMSFLSLTSIKPLDSQLLNHGHV